nr:IclR family transcriptional regulator [Microbacterium bovistercoris]
MQNRSQLASADGAPQYPIESVDNALRLILLLGEQQEIRLSEAATFLGVATSTAHRIMAMLVWRGFVRQDPRTKAYGPGPTLTNVAFSVLRKMDLPALAQPILREVSTAARETSHLGILEGSRIRFLAVSEPDVAVRVASRLGKDLPAHCTSTGKALLAELTTEQLRELYPREKLEGVTAESIKTRAQLEAQLAVVRERGYAANHEESEEGVGSVAVAVPTAARPRVAINIAAPVFRLTDEKVEAFGAILHGAAGQLAALIG